ncbi:MAG: FAD-dependent oxidoreductase, partial [Solirubrobacteraceae bacterium]
MTHRAFDVIVIGGGPAGEVAAGRLADAELEVALVERELVGGECSYYACMPSKGLLRPAQALAEARRVPGAAEAVRGDVDVTATFARRDVIIIGAGPAGEVAAGRLADAGLEVALVERELVGGECSFYACMPSKGLL